MIELRADGSMPGPKKLARIYKMCDKGDFWYASYSVELENDWPPYIEKYDTFRCFMTGFIPVGEVDAKLMELNAIGFTEEERAVEQYKHIKKQLKAALKAAEKAAKAYLDVLPEGTSKQKAIQIHTTIQTLEP